jgi:serine/threonine-protein kinase RsbW
VSLITDGAAPDPGTASFSCAFASTADDKNRELDRMLSFLEQSGAVGEEDLFWCRLVLDEALVNAVKHGNGYDESKQVAARIHIAPDRWTITVEDEGDGFSEDKVPSLEDDDSLLLNHGRGVNLMRHFMDSIAYYNGGSTLVLIKKTEHDKGET